MDWVVESGRLHLGPCGRSGFRRIGFHSRRDFRRDYGCCRFGCCGLYRLGVDRVGSFDFAVGVLFGA